MFDDTYVEFENATEKCESLGARLPVLDSGETIAIIKEYLKTSNFTVFEVSKIKKQQTDKWAKTGQHEWTCHFSNGTSRRGACGSV